MYRENSDLQKDSFVDHVDLSEYDLQDTGGRGVAASGNIHGQKHIVKLVHSKAAASAGPPVAGAGASATSELASEGYDMVVTLAFASNEEKVDWLVQIRKAKQELSRKKSDVQGSGRRASPAAGQMDGPPRPAAVAISAESDSSSSAADAGGSHLRRLLSLLSPEQQLDLIVNAHTYFQPHRTVLLPKMIPVFKGREADVLTAIVKKQGGLPKSLAERVHAMYQTYGDSMASGACARSPMTKERLDAAMEKLATLYPNAPSFIADEASTEEAATDLGGVPVSWTAVRECRCLAAGQHGKAFFNVLDPLVKEFGPEP